MTRQKSIKPWRIGSVGYLVTGVWRLTTWLSECSKLAENEYKTKHDLVGKVIHWELCKRFEFDHTGSWYMYKPELFLIRFRHNEFYISEFWHLDSITEKSKFPVVGMKLFC